MNIRQKKKFVKASAALAVMASAIVVPAQAQASQFSDLTPSQYFYDDVLNLQERGIINGFADGTFKPNASLTRGQAAKMIAGVLKLDTTNVVNPNFTDIDTNHQYYGVIAALKQAGIIDGYTDGTFKPGETMQRNHVAKILANALQLKAKNVGALPFTDVNASYKEAIAALFENNVTTGKTDTTFDGKAFVTRGQMAAFIARAEKAATPVETQAKAISGVITNVTATEITIDKQTYTIPATLKAILNKENAQALAQAPIEVTVKGKELTALNALTIVAVGTKEAPIVLQGVMQPVASTTPVNPAIDFAGVLHIKAPYVQLKNFNIAQLLVAKEAVQLTVDANVKALTVLENAAPTILGNAAIELLTIASQKAVAIETTGEIKTLNIQPKTAAVSLGKKAVIANIKTTADNAQAVITNYEAIAQNITNVNGQEVTPIIPTPPVSSGNTPTKPAPQAKEVSGVVEASSNAKVTIDGQNYTFDAAFKSLFASSGLAGATMTVSVKGDKIVAIKALTINTAGTAIEANVTIDGNVIINADNVSVKGFTITGDVQLTEQVKDAVDFDKTTIKGKLLTTENQKPVAKAKARMLVAALAPVAAETVTRLKIKFTNSSVAYIEIKTEDTDLSMFGQTTISVISVESNNSSIFADAEIVLPTVQISKGATQIELNASIASVEITSTSSVAVTGKGNFDKVKVDVPEDKAVSLKTEGTIKEISTSENAGIELSTTVKVGKTTDLEGAPKLAEEVVKNYEEVKDNVNVEIKDEELEQYIVAKAMPVEDRFGYATLHVQNAENYEVKYRLVNWGTEPVAVGKPVPANAITYNKGDEFIAWQVSNIEVYKVDKDGLIVDAFRADNWAYHSSEQTLQIQDGKLTLKSNFAPLDRISFAGGNLVNNGQFMYIEASTKAQWSVDEDGIPTYTLELPEGFNYDATQEARLQYTIYANTLQGDGGSSTTTWSTINGYDDTRMIDVIGLNGLVKLPDLRKGQTLSFIEQLLSNSAYEAVQVLDEENGYEYTRHDSLFNRYLSNHYIKAIQKTPLTSYDHIKEMVVTVNEENVDYVAAIKAAEKAVVALYKENRYDYDYYERLADDVTTEKIEAAERLVVALNDTEETLEVTWELNSAKGIYGNISKITALQTLAQQFQQQAHNTEAYWNARDEIYMTFNRFAYEEANNGNHVQLANEVLFDQYVEALVKQPVTTIAQLKKIVTTVNETNDELLKKYEQVKNSILALLVPDHNTVNYNEPLVDGVTAEQVAQAEKAYNELAEVAKKGELQWLMNKVKDAYAKNVALAEAKAIANEYIQAVAENKEQQALREQLDALINNTEDFKGRLFYEYVKQLAVSDITKQQQLTKLVADVNKEFADELVRYEEMEKQLQALYAKDEDGNYTSEQLAPMFTVQQFAEAEKALEAFKEKTKLDASFDYYIYQARYLFDVESQRPAQLLKTMEIPLGDGQVQFTFTFSEAIQGDIAVEFSGVEATNAQVEVQDKEVIITATVEKNSLSAVTITGVQDENGNAIELANIPLTYWDKQ